MRTSLLRRLLRRSSQPQHTPVAPSTAMLTHTWRAYRRFDEDFEEDPSMCVPRPGLPTRHVTRIIDQGETIARWKDEEGTWTMETLRVEV